MLMEYTKSVPRMLHDEHLASIAMMERCGAALAKYRRKTPDAADPEVAALLGELASLIASDVAGHFEFEEQHLFPRLDAGGDSGMTTILQDEHDTILPLGQRVAALGTAAQADGFTDESWRDFARLAGELIERMISHIQKEEMGLLPALEDMLDEAEDGTLSIEYAASR